MDDGRGAAVHHISAQACPAVAAAAAAIAQSPTKPKTRSLSDSDGTPNRLSPSPRIIKTTRLTTKDDSEINASPLPVTPRRPGFPSSSLALQLPPHRDSTPPPAAVSNVFARPAPLSPQLDRSNSYASPMNILPRRSRGLDFSRAATSLHHSTLAEQSSPDSSPVMGNKAMMIPGRRDVFGRGTEQVSSSLWSMMGNQERSHLSNSLGSTHAVMSDSSSSSDDDDMDEDMDEAFVTTPQVSRIGNAGTFGSPAMGGLMSFQHRQRNRKALKKKGRGPIGLGFNHSGASSISNSPPNNITAARRESISWQANQLHISNIDAEENGRGLGDVDLLSGDGQRQVVRRAVTRRGNMLVSVEHWMV